MENKIKSLINVIEAFGESSKEVVMFLKIMVENGEGDMVAEVLSRAVEGGHFLPERVFDILISIPPEYSFEQDLYSRNNPKINKIIDSDNETIQVILARKGYFLEEFFNHQNPLIRVEVARHGFRLDELMNDQEDMVRFEAAIQKYSESYN